MGYWAQIVFLFTLGLVLGAIGAKFRKKYAQTTVQHVLLYIISLLVCMVLGVAWTRFIN